MYLHENKDMFTEMIEAVNIETGIAQSIIEKDYYVTMILRLLSIKCPNVVFKGGTSLSKCYHIINRFSEDIDITFPEHIGESRRKKLKYNILKPISEELGMPIQNWNNIQSDRDYNYYLFGYAPISEYPDVGLLPGIKLETALISYAYPTEEKEVSSILYDTLKNEIPDTLEEYNLLPFSMMVQSIDRTFIDKIYALCGYYMEGKSKRYSRHLYDIYRLYPQITINGEFNALVKDVRKHRATLSICPSAKDEVDLYALIDEFLNNEFYKRDYEEITRTLIADNVTYEQTAHCLKDISDQLFLKKE